MKKLIAAVTTAGLLVVGTAGVATAADSPTTQAPASVQGNGRRIAAAGQVAAKTIGIAPAALRDAVMGGKTVAEVARSHNVDPQAVIDAIVAAANTRIDAAVASGKIDAPRAATIKAHLPQRVTKLVNSHLKGKAGRGVKIRRHARQAAAVVAAKTIGIAPAALRDAVKSGKSVADVARSHHVDPQVVIDAVVSAMKTKVDEAVAAGKIKADRAATIKARLSERITKLVNATPRQRAAGSA